jgi:hypothetical protein
MRFACLLPALLLGLQLLTPAQADEAILPDGRRLPGELRGQADGRLRFATAKQAFRLDEVQQVRFSTREVAPLRAGVVHRITLHDGQQLTGELQGLDGETLRLRTVWAERPLSLPRAAVAAISQLPGHCTYFDDDFEAGLKSWKLTGTPTLSDKEHTSGTHSLLLDSGGQSAEYSLASGLQAGQVGINFLDPGAVSGARWLVEAVFESADGPRLLRVVIAGEAMVYGVQAPWAKVEEKGLKRSAGWHRLTVEFGRESLSVLVDDAVLGSSERQGPGGLLRKVCLICEALPGKGAASGKVWLDDFGLARAVQTLRRPAGDLDQDEVWLLSGDQLFGNVVRCDRRTLNLKGLFGERSLPWGDVRGIRLKNAMPPPRTTEGEHVRLRLHPGAGHELDEIEGVLRGLDDRSLSLRHLAGELVIPRDRVRRLHGTLWGRRHEIDLSLHHLGAKLLPGASVPKPEGLGLQRKFTLDAVPAEAHLVIAVSHLKGPGDGNAIAQALKRGGLRTELFVNGRLHDYLNRHGERASTEPRRLRLTVPGTLLRAGENVLEVRQVLDRETGQVEDCVISGLALEVPR